MRVQIILNHKKGDSLIYDSEMEAVIDYEIKSQISYPLFSKEDMNNLTIAVNKAKSDYYVFKRKMNNNPCGVSVIYPLSKGRFLTVCIFDDD